jgi:hypothetical protein
VQIISSGLETQKSPPDLSRFGDYGRIVNSQPHTSLTKNLAPPGLVNLTLKYRQIVPGIYELRPEESAGADSRGRTNPRCPQRASPQNLRNSPRERTRPTTLKSIFDLGTTPSRVDPKLT